jgi:hypothetical protein
VLRGARLIVDDRFEPPRHGLLGVGRPAAVRVGWQLGPAWEARFDDGVLVARAGGSTLAVKLDPALTWSLVRGSTSAGGGWVAGNEGELLPAPLLLGEGPLSGRREIRCSFSLT